VINKLKMSADQDINLEPYKAEDVNKEFYKTLEQFEASKKTVSKAWVSYFEGKKAGLDTTEILRNALILDCAHAELASQVISDKEFNRGQAQALGHDVEKLEKYAKKHEASELVNRYEKSKGLLRGHYAHVMSSHIEDFDKALKTKDLNKRSVLEDAWEYQRKLDKLKLSTDERKSSHLVDTYFEYGKQARGLWSKIYKSKDKGMKPELSLVAFASHVSNLRNQLAEEIVKHSEKYDASTSHLQPKTKKAIENHAKKFEENLKRKARRTLVANTKDWREVVSYDQAEFGKQQHIQHNYNQSKKVYWDKDLVLREAMPKAEEIISGLLSEEKNTRMSKGNKIVWGKKNGSVHFHTGGSKEGVINDYERNIHGDLITFYAKSMGLDWYDALSELAADVGINPERGAIQPVEVSEDAKQKKQQAILGEQKRRAKVRQLAEKTWDESKPIVGTMVETYLKKHRGADFDVSKMDVRFNPKAPVYTHKEGDLKVFARKPAMIVRFENEANELTAVQCTYLDPKTSNKDKDAKVGKMTVGSQWESAGKIYHGGDDKVIVAEGAETAMSLIQAEPKAAIYITGGNMQNIQHYDTLALKHGKNEIHIAADNDLSKEAGSWKSTEAGARKLAEKGVRPLVYQPESIKGQKTDYNDVYKRYGSAEVKKQFSPQYTIEPKSSITEKTKLIPIAPMKKQTLKAKEPDAYRIPDFDSKKIKAPEKGKGVDTKNLGEKEK
jgi:hypothetical protein